jgi:hypothetical protein
MQNVMFYLLKAMFGWRPTKFRPRESFMHEVLNEIYLQKLFTDECNFVRRIHADPKKFWNFVVHNFFNWNRIVNEIQIWISQIWNSNFINDLK